MSYVAVFIIYGQGGRLSNGLWPFVHILIPFNRRLLMKFEKKKKKKKKKKKNSEGVAKRTGSDHNIST